MDKKAPWVPAILALLAVSMPVPARAQPQPGPRAVAAIAARPAATDFQLSPKNRQDEEQQWFDRYECDSQAKRQSRYDPTNEQDEASPQAASEEYVRVMTTCLTQRGYEVRYVPPESPPPLSPTPYQPPSEQRPARELHYRALSVEAGGGYSVAAGSTADYVLGGADAGAALSWFPSAALPIGLRVEGGYMWFKPASQLLALNGVGYNKGQQDLYGGDVDLQLNLSPLPARQQLYLAAGVGWYRIATLLQEVSGQRVCGVHYCSIFQTLLAQEHDTSPWESSWNAGLGWEIALDSHTAFFLEVRYRRIHRDGGGLQLVPIWLGLRF
jgi:opacity protein-like surface antigen